MNTVKEPLCLKGHSLEGACAKKVQTLHCTSTEVSALAISVWPLLPYNRSQPL